MPPDLNDRLAAIEHKLEHLLESITGNDDMGHVGLVTRVRKAEACLAEHANLVMTVKAKILGALCASTLIGGFLNWMLGLHFAPDK